MDETIGVFGGIIGIAVGVWLLASSIKNSLPESMRIRWLPKDLAGRENIERLLGIIVGAGFIIIGFLMFILNLSRLFS